VVLFNTGAAMMLARDAKDNAIRAEMAAGALSVELHAHVLECGRNWEKLDRNMSRAEESRASDQRQWREDLVDRLNRQDKVLWSSLLGVITTLLLALGFMIAHLNIFHFT